MLEINKTQLQETIDSLKASTNKEKVLLWFGKSNAHIVSEVYEPIQFAELNYFEVPPEGIQAIFSKVKDDKIIVLAQIHTHPGRAFHSSVDDRMAIPRHVGAYSLVLPRFARKVSIENFHQQVLIYKLNDQGCWVKVNNSNLQIYE